LVRSRRCCCVCHQFAGLYTNVHHIVRESNSGSNDLENAIALCLRCHGEAGHYNVQHPIGNKYSPEELRRHRDKWWEWCESNPDAPLPNDPISVSPGAIILAAQDWRARSLFKIHNRTNEIYYQVWVKLTIDTVDIHTKDISIDLAKPKDELHMKIGTITISGDIMRFNCTDQAGNRAIFLLLANLNPGEISSFVLTNNSLYTPSASTKPKAFIGVCGFARKPAPTLFQPGKKVAFSFKPPEAIKLESISVLMKR
jgi:hypothetical protein